MECQDCGEVIRELSPAEARAVADKPYNFVVFCRQCAAEQEREVSRA